MTIYLLSSVYPSQEASKGTTPVVHYFAKEWALSGHQVHVFHTASSFPKVYYFFARPFKKILYSWLGHTVAKHAPKEYDEIIDEVFVSHIVFKKIKPHGRFSRKQINRAFSIVSAFIEKEGLPDCFVGHWDNPQLELLHLLKARFHRPTCIVYHSNRFDYLRKIYGSDVDILIKDIDLVGFRNYTAREEYESMYGKAPHSFIAASGVSQSFINAGKNSQKKLNDNLKFIYVGALISRKYPITVIDSLFMSYRYSPFSITYIGEGQLQADIQHRFAELACKGELIFTGRLSREEIIDYLIDSDVFVMVSRGEVFGLVYLEAMSLGCITIASRNEGIDGIIEDGVNGFLCEAGNVEELANIISRIRMMSGEELKKISDNAKSTAIKYSDINVANNYIEALNTII
jgi:glycosyltransferase involved in cell wall biosynthesis